MSHDRARRPSPSEHVAYYARYVERVPDGDVVDTLGRQIEDTLLALKGLPPERARHRYAEGKWSVSQVVGHLADAERVFAYRTLAFARGDRTELPGFDENAYAESSPAAQRTLPDVLEDLLSVRRATVCLLRALEPEAWSRSGVANGDPISVRALAWIMAGHERHHLAVLRERYLVA